MEALGFELRQEAILETLTEDVVKSNEIEGEALDLREVRSSVARRLGMEIGGLPSLDSNVEGAVDMTLDATGKYDQPVTFERLFAWHSSLFPTGRSGMRRIRVDGWREGPIQVISGAIGAERIHFEAPAADCIKKEMSAFVEWFNAVSTMDGVVKASLAHLWFVTVHPFEDGNGRIARVIADLALARSEHSSRRFYSMSSQIRRERSQYYRILESTQKGSMDITPWMLWFIACLGRAISGAQETLARVLRKARFWSAVDQSLNERQRLMLNRLLDGFEGRLTSSKWALITRCSQDTASRDIADLVGRGVLVRNPGGGRNTSYALSDEGL